MFLKEIRDRYKEESDKLAKERGNGEFKYQRLLKEELEKMQ